MAGETSKDPVCGMMVPHDRAAATTQYQGKTVYFCHRNCKERFEKNPQAYLK